MSRSSIVIPRTSSDAHDADLDRDANPAPEKFLTFPQSSDGPLTIRAKAVTFNDPESIKLLQNVERVAASEVTVLIIGETGTGKELIARHIHECSGRSGPFIAVNCGAFTDTLIDAELFGHESGAYTGARQARAGWFEVANGGTLFLDEIGDMPLSLQVKLLRVLQERQVVRIGARSPMAVDVRLIAATNVDLAKAVQAGRFRTDLFYRLNVAPVTLPPLRARTGDILPLARHFGQLYKRKLGLSAAVLSPAAEQALLSYEWPGNIRELENVVHYALIVSHDGRIELSDLRLPHLPGQTAISVHATDAPPDAQQLLNNLQNLLGQIMHSKPADLYETVEKALITAAYDHCGGNQVHTARELAISRNVLRAKLKQYGLIGTPPFVVSED